jgi:hypothetical protein
MEFSVVKRKVRWLMEPWPHGWRFWFFALVGIVPSILILRELWEISPEVEPGARLFPAGTAMLILAYYGFHRALRFHPATDLRYREWLICTPYHPAGPLPVGPVLLVWRDAVLIGPITLLLVGNGTVPIYAGLGSFLFGYIATMAYIMKRLSMDFDTWVIRFALAIVVAVASQPLFSLVILGLIYVCAVPGIRRSLANDVLSKVSVKSAHDFHRLRMVGVASESAKKVQQASARWDCANAIDPSDRPGNLSPFEYGIVVGWPLAIMGPVNISDRWQTPATAMASASVAGAWVIALLIHVPETLFSRLGIPHPEFLAVLFALALAARRATLYMACSWPDTTMLGRLVTGRPLRWRFDRMLSTPCIVALTGLCAPIVLHYIGLSVAWVTGITVFASMLLSKSGAPTLRNWILTGHYRLTGALRGRDYLWRV